MPAKIARQSKELDIEVDKGSTLRHAFTWKSGNKGSEVPVDLSGCTARLLVKDLNEYSQVGTTELYDMTTENGRITLNNNLGEIELYVSDEDSTAFTWNNGYYGLEIYFSNGDTKRLLRGRFTAYDEIVR